MFQRVSIRNFDFKLVLMVVALSIVGIFAIGSAEESLQAKQLAGVVAGTALMVIIAFFNYSWILKFYWVMYAVNVGLLLWVAMGGEKHGGATRWIQIGGLQFQPSETAKILLLLFFAQFIMKCKGGLKSFRNILLCIALLAVPLLLILGQPDLSTSIVIVVLFCFILYAGGISYKFIFSVAVVAIPVILVVLSLALSPENVSGVSFLQGFQQNRLISFFNRDEYPDLVRQQNNSVTAIASGQLDGKGYKNNELSSVKNGNFLSEAETDFIFAIIGEEFGFKGCLVVIGLIMAIAIECINVARRSRDTAGCIIAAGMGGLIAFQGFINIGVATFILPNTGLPLPFVSSGLTSLISLYGGMGFVLSVRLRANKTLN